ncbi:MAG TPA: YfhO family protein [Lentimicrobium sp.]|nr:YfhO family protein [Lentimicrobium sp.]
MNKSGIKKLTPHLVAIIIMVILAFAYFHPLLEGKKLFQSDTAHWQGMSKEISDYRKATGEEALWTNSMFGGMPAYQISVKYTSNLIAYLDSAFRMGLPHPAGYLFLYFIGFYILLISLRVNPWLAIPGAIAYAFSSYFLIILEAGHNSKAHAIGYVAPVIAGILLTYRGKLFLGSLLTAIFLSLEIKANHLQITYYLLIILVFLVLCIFIDSIRNKKLNFFFKASGFLFIAAILAIATNLSSLWTTYEYGKETIRGKTELTSEKENRTSGLDKDYAVQWSYGKVETFSLMIPNIKGGATDAIGNNEKAFKNVDPQVADAIARQNHYWGDQPFTSGPVYLGAIIAFLFILGLFITKGNLRWWLLVITVLSIMLSWGKNFMPLTNFFLDNVPAYNKFRAVSMILVIANFAIPLLAVLALQALIDNPEKLKHNKKPLWISFGVTAGLAFLFYLLPDTFFSFLSDAENAGFQQQRGSLDSSQLQNFNLAVQNLVQARIDIFKADTLRSFLLILAMGGLVLAFILKKLKKEYFIIAFGILILIDMIPVASRYLNKDDFQNKSKVSNPYQPTQADNIILKDTDPNFRVLNLTVSTFTDASTSYFHKSLGGYHGAKLRRYQEIIDHHIAKNNMNVLNMLNTKYFIVPGQDRQPQVQINFNALGNAWFVNEYKIVNNADEEINALTDFNPATTAIIDKRFLDQVKDLKINPDTTATIKLTSYAPNKLKYSYKSNNDQLVVFSEIYYDKGWKAFIDNKPAPYFRANYILRAMVVPAGSHNIEFRFEPKAYYMGNTISMVSSLILILLTLAYVFYMFRMNRATDK